VVSGSVARPDQVSLGVLVAAVPRHVVDEAVAVCGVKEKRSGGKLPAHVTAYLTMALCLFAEDDYEEVAQKVTGSLSVWGCWDAAWSPPTAGAITQARGRLGPDVPREVFVRIAEPVAELSTRGAWLGRRRLMAIDGFELDVPDTPANAQRFGYAGNDQARSAFPKARVVAVAECGTHAFVDAQIGGWHDSEHTLATPLLDRLDADWLLTADRGFYSFAAWCTAADTGADLLWRAPGGLGLPVVEVLPDGTYTSLLIAAGVRGSRRHKLLGDAKAGRELDPDLARLVRVVEYEVPDRGQDATRELICLITTITDPAVAHADQLASGYHERWEEEGANAELKTRLRGPGKILRSRSPDLVLAEIWAYLTVQHAIAALISRAATGADIDPDRISFARALRLIRRTATGTAAFPP
jgi:hypothetical protein